MIERIFLIGFMGTGKTTIGTALATELDWAMIDSDHEIVRREGRDIPAIFAAEGEAYFRCIESEVLTDLATKQHTVITTGGGCVLAASNRELMAQSGLVVCLQASVEEIVRRVSEDSNRPLLQGEDVRGRVEKLVHDRQGLYDFAHVTIDTTGREIASIVEEITAFLSASSR
ncbi:MAG: shikimate kinase [Tumebacillaceae bacterium]